MQQGLQAVDTLYNDPRPESKKEAEAWLLEVRYRLLAREASANIHRSLPEAWELAWALLSYPEPHPALQYQGGIILQYKVVVLMSEDL